MNQEQTNITTGKQIRHLRTQLGMTQEELAGELNVTRQALSNWERDVNEPDLNMLKKICFLFGVNMDDFAKEVITKMALIQRFGVYYADFRVPRGKRARISLQTTNLRVAKDKYAELVSRRKKAKENLIVDMEWDAFKDRLFRFMSAERSESTIRWTKLAIKHMEDFNAPRHLRDVTPNLLQGTKEFMINEGFGKHNVNRCMQALKAIMRLAEKWDLMPEQKWKAVGKLKTPKGRVVFHTDEEIDKLLAACPSLGWRIVVLLGADAGLRRGEIAQLRWQDVDFEHNQLYVAPDKTENHRYVPMTSTLRETLLQAQKGAKSEYVVDVGWASSRNSKDFLTSYYPRIAKAAGVKSFLHKLRHTYASQLVQKGVGLYEVSKLLGHSSIQMTEIYAHLVPANLQQAAMCITPRKMPEFNALFKNGAGAAQ